MASAAAKQYIEPLALKGADVDEHGNHLVAPGLAEGWCFSAALGWTLLDCERPGFGIDGSTARCRYEASGCRARVNFPEQTARIHTYGDSFTHGDQVSDGETWQEVLAAHMQDSIENYGVGGYSVYQAYLRMLEVEARHPAEFVILNIYDDDHLRNLDPCR